MKKFTILAMLLVLAQTCFGWVSMEGRILPGGPDNYGFSMSRGNAPDAPKYALSNIFTNKTLKVDISTLGKNYKCKLCKNRTIKTYWKHKKDLTTAERNAVRDAIGFANLTQYSDHQNFQLTVQCTNCLHNVWLKKQQTAH